MRLVLPERVYPDETAQRQFTTRALDAVRAVPGVEVAAVSNVLPAANGNSTRSVEADGHPIADPRAQPSVANRLVTPDYFAMMRIPIQRGRAFTAADREDSGKVAIVSENMAKKL